jgi:hypothetical protein
MAAVSGRVEDYRNKPYYQIKQFTNRGDKQIDLSKYM